MIKVSTHGGEGFRVLTSYGEWKIGMIRYNERFSRLGEMERHLLVVENQNTSIDNTEKKYLDEKETL